jgi:hypothetical protein
MSRDALGEHMTDEQFDSLLKMVNRIAVAAEKQAAACERGHDSAIRSNETLDARGKTAEEAHAASRDRSLLEIEILKEERERRRESHERFNRIAQS